MLRPPGVAHPPYPAGYCSTPLLRDPLSQQRMHLVASIAEYAAWPLGPLLPAAIHLSASGLSTVQGEPNCSLPMVNRPPNPLASRTFPTNHPRVVWVRTGL